MNLFRSIFGSKRRSGKVESGSLKVPYHLAVIMDGNGRWAKKRGLPRSAGHRAGAENLERVCRLCNRYGISYLTVYAFSTENWSRPADEVQALMNLFIEFINRFENKMAQEGIRIRFSGDLTGLPEPVQQAIRDAEEKSRNRTRLQLVIAINYGGRREILHACQMVARRCADGELDWAKIDETTLSHAMYLSDVPDPDLLIRPSGEMRLSNFLIWQSAYTELWFSDVLWPSFGEKDFVAALQAFSGRDRRFGGIRET